MRIPNSERVREYQRVPLASTLFTIDAHFQEYPGDYEYNNSDEWERFANSFRVGVLIRRPDPGRCPGLKFANAFGVW